MTSIGMDLVVKQLRAVVREAFDGPPDGISAEHASRPVAGTTIAAHVHHAAFALDASTA